MIHKLYDCHITHENNFNDFNLNIFRIKYKKVIFRKRGIIMKNKFLIALGAAGMVYCIALKNYNVTFWPYLFMLCTLYVLWILINIYSSRNTSKKLLKACIKTINTFLLLIFCSFIIIEGLIISNSFKKDTRVPDYIIILGAGLRGSTPSQALYDRLNESLKLLGDLPESVKIIVTGGMGPGETMTESQAMKDYLVSKGIDENRIIEENKASSTFENMKYSKAIIDATGKKNYKVTIVTNNFHMLRSKILAKRVGFKEVYCHASPLMPYITPVYYFREYFALIKSAVFDR